MERPCEGEAGTEQGWIMSGPEAQLRSLDSIPYAVSKGVITFDSDWTQLLSSFYEPYIHKLCMYRNVDIV